ncbi:MAG TPA: type I glyceraldehyde-3-phosphate dehydrogenase [Alphaproteobacteria bacterium]|nr:type I glyceraldehyde-3-phosphate dehydrogenase [Alphaproteobacteria bacterium]
MAINIFINGFGRIGRMVLRALAENPQDSIKIVGINDLAPLDTNLHLLAFDSIHGRLGFEIEKKDSGFSVKNGSKSLENILCTSTKDPSELPLKDLNVDVVLECTGHFTKKQDAMKLIQAGAKRVLISAPREDADFTVVYGINHQDLKADHQIISNGSCTTNCLVPVAHALHNTVGIEYGYMTTIHAYTGDQRLVDTAHNDLHRARAAAQSMIPTSTGAAKAVSKVLPDLKGKLDGTAIRVPTANVSVVDFTFTAKKLTSIEEINGCFENASNGYLKGILGINKLPLVSIDFNHQPQSSIADLTQTQVIDGKFCRVLSWYDNEWGFSNRMIDVLNIM